MKLPGVFQGRRLVLLAKLLGNALLQGMGAIATAVLVRRVFDLAIGQSAALSGLVPDLLGLLLVAFALALLRMVERIDAERLGQNYVFDVRMLLFARLCQLSPRTLQSKGRGGTLLRFIGDLTALRQWISRGLARLGVAGLTTLIALVALGVLNLALAFALAGLLLTAALASIVAGRAMRQAVAESRKRRVRLTTNINEKISSMAVVQLFGQTERERERVARQGGRLSEAMVARARVTGQLRAITEWTGSMAVAVILGVGAIEVAAGRASAGTLVSAMAIIGLLVPALRDLGRVHEYWHSVQVSREKIASFLGHTDPAQPKPQAGRVLPDAEGSLEFQEVSMTGLFAGINRRVPYGTRVAIVGPNGAGKSTLLSLVARFQAPDQGRVLLGGRDLAEYRADSVRRFVGMVSQDLPLLRGSVRRNLTYRAPDADDSMQQQIRSLCELDSLIHELPEGEQTRVSEGGANLSLGQRQRLALARALLGNPRLLLLDEAEANLDTQAQEILERVIKQFQGTILMVTHRQELLCQADEIWHISQGRLVECGSPEVLLSRPGPTSRLFMEAGYRQAG